MKSILILIVILIFHFFYPGVIFGQTPALGTASGFALFTGTGSTFTNIGVLTSVTGDVGANTGSHNAFPPGTLYGNSHWADAVSAQAATDVGTAYSQMSTAICTTTLGTPFGNGDTLTPGVYCTVNAAAFNGNLILDGGGNSAAIFIFKINGALSTGTHSNIILINSANLCNVYWQVSGAFSLGDSSVFRGTVINSGSISLLEGSSLLGRGLSTAGAIDLHNNIVTYPLLSASVSISVNPTGTICSGSSVSFTATPINGGTTPTYQWKNGGVNISGETNSTYTSTTLGNGDVITVEMTSAAACVIGSPAISSGIVMSVNQTPTTSAVYHQ
jgi:hypothetical protein